MIGLGRAAGVACSLAAIALVCIAGPALSASAETGPPELVVELEPASVSVALGESIDLRIRVTNTGGTATPPLKVHLDILAPDSSASADPEDWTPILTRAVDAVAPGGSAALDWTVQPIAAGTFAPYAVAIPDSGDRRLAASNAARVVVVDRRSLNPGSILPVAIAVPTLIGVLLAFQLRVARRTGRPGGVDQHVP